MKINLVIGNTYYIDAKAAIIPFYKIDENQIILLDSGWIGKEMEELIALLESEKLEVAGIITSHAHIDHVGSNAYFKGKGARIAMPFFEAASLASSVNLKAWYSMFTLKEIEDMFPYMICDTDILIHREDTDVTICGVKFGIIHTPGHTPEHICISTPDNVLYLADVIMGYYDLKYAKIPYAYSLKLDFESKRLLYNIKAEKYILAHGGPCADIKDLIDANIKLYEQCLDDIEGVIKGSMKMEEIIRDVIDFFGLRAPNLFKYRLLERNIRTFAEHLVDTGRLSYRFEDGYMYYIAAK